MINQNSITVDLRVEPGVVALVNVNGTLVAEVTVGKADGRDSLLAEVRAARALSAVPVLLRSTLVELERAERLPDHVNREGGVLVCSRCVEEEQQARETEAAAVSE